MGSEMCIRDSRHSPRSLAVCESASPQVCSCMFPCVFSYALSCFSPPFALFELMVTLICFVLFFSSNAVPSISVAAHTTDVCIWCIRTLISLYFSCLRLHEVLQLRWVLCFVLFFPEVFFHFSYWSLSFDRGLDFWR